MPQKILIALGGATGSGKTALAVELAKQYPQLVILSADSRQIYKKLDIGSAKVGNPSFDVSLTGRPEPVWRIDGVPQYLIDIAEPGTIFTLAEYQKEAFRLIHACWEKLKIPLLVGGTGLYIQAVTEGYTLTGRGVSDDRAELDQLSVAALQQRLQEMGVTVVSTDWQNKRRLIRAIERAQSDLPGNPNQNNPLTKTVYIYVLTRSWDDQRALAPLMVQERLDLGLVKETQSLLAYGVDKSWLKSMGLSYRLVIQMLDGEFPEQLLNERMTREFRQLMRRQRTWFNRMPQVQKVDKAAIAYSISALF